MIKGVGAVLLISENADSLAAFYRNAIGLPLEDEKHEGVPLHYGRDLGGVHFAIHPAATWPGEATANPLSPGVVLNTDDAEAAYQRLVHVGCAATPPFDHGFGILVSLRDPDGNNIQLMETKAG